MLVENKSLEMAETHTPSSLHPHYDVIQHNEKGGVYLGTSSLTGRDWTGSLWYFADESDAPYWDKCTAGVNLYSGVSDMKLLKDDIVVLASDAGAVEWWKLEESELSCLASEAQHDDLVTSLDILADNSSLVSASYDKRVIVWDANQHAVKSTFRGHGGPVHCVCAHPTDANIFLSCAQDPSGRVDGRVLMWDLRNPKPAKMIDVSVLASVVTCCSWQPDTMHMFAVGTESGDACLLDSRTEIPDHQMPRAAQPHTRVVHKIAFCPDTPTRLASVSEDCTVAITDFELEPIIFYKDNRHNDFVRGLSWSPVSGKLFSSGWDSQIFTHVPHTDVLMTNMPNGE